MKVYGPSDKIAPIVTNLQTTGNVGGLSPSIVGPGLIGFGVLVWVYSVFSGALKSASALASAGMVDAHKLAGETMSFGFGLALVLVGIAVLSRRMPTLAQFGSRHRLAIIIGGITVLLITFGPAAMLAFVPGARPFGTLFIIGFAINFAGIPLWLLQRRNGRRIAAEMRDAVPPVPLFTEAPIAVAPATPSAPASPGELVILLYEIDDLPVAGPFSNLLTANANIVGQPPCRFLYLYNFFADAISTKLRPTAGWPLHGPVAMLASPLELARAAGYRFDMAQSVESQLLTDPGMIAARVAAMADVPLPPHSPKLAKLFADFGAYPEDVLLCTDATWQAGVAALTARADKVIMDAADFSPARQGLAWEIQHVLNHFATEDFVVLVNSFTDFPALGAEVRRAWGHMTATSPNNRQDEARLHVVLLTGDDVGGFDDESALGARPTAIRNAERIAAHDRIVTLLRAG